MKSGRRFSWPGILTASVFATLLVSGCGEKAGDSDTPGGDLTGESQDLGGIRIVVPHDWVVETPSSQMRKAQFRLPGKGPDDAQLVVFNFGPGQAGSVEANLQRWYGQITQPDGSPSGNAAQTSEKMVDGMEVTLMDVSGTYRESMGPMMQGGAAKTEWRMAAAIVESPQGAFYFKLVGPEATVARWKPEFKRFIDAVKKS